MKARFIVTAVALLAVISMLALPLAYSANLNLSSNVTNTGNSAEISSQMINLYSLVDDEYVPFTTSGAIPPNPVSYKVVRATANQTIEGISCVKDDIVYKFNNVSNTDVCTRFYAMSTVTGTVSVSTVLEPGVSGKTCVVNNLSLSVEIQDPNGNTVSNGGSFTMTENVYYQIMVRGSWTAIAPFKIHNTGSDYHTYLLQNHYLPSFYLKFQVTDGPSVMNTQDDIGFKGTFELSEDIEVEITAGGQEVEKTETTVTANNTQYSAISFTVDDSGNAVGSDQTEYNVTIPPDTKFVIHVKVTHNIFSNATVSVFYGGKSIKIEAGYLNSKEVYIGWSNNNFVSNNSLNSTILNAAISGDGTEVSIGISGKATTVLLSTSATFEVIFV